MILIVGCVKSLIFGLVYITTKGDYNPTLTKMGLTTYLLFSIFVANCGMFQDGFYTHLINFKLDRILSMSNMTVTDETNTTSLEEVYTNIMWFPIGSIIGEASGGFIANCLGRKGGLFLSSTLSIFGGISLGLRAWLMSFWIDLLGRIVVGFSCGLSMILTILFVIEIAPLNSRGALAALSPLISGVGALMSQILSSPEILGNERGYFFLMALAVAPAVAQICLLPFCTESPRHLLISKEKENRARLALCKIRATKHVDEELQEMRVEQRSEDFDSTMSILNVLCSTELRAPLFTSVILQLSQQLTGITAVSHYMLDFFTWVGLSSSHRTLAITGFVIIPLLVTLISIFLIDLVGRRTLHLYGLGGMFIFSITISISLFLRNFDAVSYLAIFSALGFMVFFSLGPAVVPWIIASELFIQEARAAAISINSIIISLSSFIVGLTFYILKYYLGAYIFLPYIIFIALFWFFTYKKVPETKMRTFLDISESFD